MSRGFKYHVHHSLLLAYCGCSLLSILTAIVFVNNVAILVELVSENQ